MCGALSVLFVTLYRLTSESCVYYTHILILGSKPLYEIQTGEVTCSMCMNLTKDPVCQVKCGHSFCESCTKHFFEKTMICPVCKKENLPRGNQPVGYMTRRSEKYSSLPGYEKFGTIVLTFNFDSGIQGTVSLN